MDRQDADDYVLERVPDRARDSWWTEKTSAAARTPATLVTND
jgi:hypothetical protein